MLSEDRLREAIQYWMDKEDITNKEYEVTAFSNPTYNFNDFEPKDDSIETNVMIEPEEIEEFLIENKDYFTIDDMDDDMDFNHPYYSDLFDDFEDKFDEYINDYASHHPEINEYAYNKLELGLDY